jgi:penicillin-binding protein 1C
MIAQIPFQRNLKQYTHQISRWLLSRWQRAVLWAKRHPKKTLIGAILLGIWLFCLPRPLFDTPYSTVLMDRDGLLLGARIAQDGQWRFPARDTLPDKYVTCLIAYEDRRFRWHPGVDPISLGQALWANMRQGRTVRGGSTITMQVIRMARNNPPRTLWQKLVEVCMATRLELTCSKNEILAHYAAHAPYGGNVVGLEAASWRYYAKSPALLSWAEAATLAVLPNSPALIHPGRQRDALLQKRNRLLRHLAEDGQLTAFECELACSEPLPDQPHPLPMLAPHLLDKFAQAQAKPQSPFAAWFATQEGRFGNVEISDRALRSSLNRTIQEQVTEILIRRQSHYAGNGVHNLAAVVIDVKTGEVLAYVGNVPGAGKQHGESVDVITAARSTGSILKPYLYSLALESGDILPQSLLRDVPTQIGKYRPENFYNNYDGAISAKRALVRSLNVPFVLLLQQHGVEKFHYELSQLGITTVQKPPEHYGLSLILGGAEANLLDITNVYASMARRLGAHYERDGRVAPDDFRPPVFQPVKKEKKPVLLPASTAQPLSAGSIWHTFMAMQDVERPNTMGEWDLFETSRRVAWKTGTSFGFRDAWAAGTNARYAVGVWVGNADGEGRPGLVGVEMAAPVLFEIFARLPGGDAWFDPPYDDMAQITVCPQSGGRAGPYCTPDTTWVPRSGLKAPACTYHQLLHLDSTAQWQVTSTCASPLSMVHRPWFVVPPVEEHYYKYKHPDYAPPPPWRADCMGAGHAEQAVRPIQLIYPRQDMQIYIPVDLDGTLGSVVFTATHRQPETQIFWHLDDTYVGVTKTFHQMPLQPAVGKHIITLVDAQGHRTEQRFEVMGK